MKSRPAWRRDEQQEGRVFTVIFGVRLKEKCLARKKKCRLTKKFGVGDPVKVAFFKLLITVQYLHD